MLGREADSWSSPFWARIASELEVTAAQTKSTQVNFFHMVFAFKFIVSFGNGTTFRTKISSVVAKAIVVPDVVLCHYRQFCQLRNDLRILHGNIVGFATIQIQIVELCCFDADGILFFDVPFPFFRDAAFDGFGVRQH